MALQTFEQFGMVEIIDGVITIPNWGKHQNLEQLEERKRYQREYHREYRKKQKLLADGGKDLRKCLRNDDVNTLEGDKERDKERKEDTVTCKQVVDLYHSVCISYPSVKTLSEARRKAIKARLNTYSLDDFRTLFEKAEASAFLKGSNDRNWTANFDWLIKDANMAKVIDGNYDKQQRPKGSKPSSTNKFNNFPQRDYDFDTLEQQLLNSQQEPQGDK